jgi:AcrR family transcriptional regulator
MVVGLTFAVLMESQSETNRVLSGAEGLFMRYGIKSVTMDDVARELGVSKKTLYLHVDNKADLIRKIIVAHISAEKAAMAEIVKSSDDAIDEMMKVARYMLRLLRQISPNLIYDLRKYHSDSWTLLESLHKGYMYDLIRGNLERGVSQGLYRADLDPDIIARLYVGKTRVVVDEDIFPLDTYKREHLYAISMEYHIRGVASSRGLERLTSWKEINPDNRM